MPFIFIKFALKNHRWKFPTIEKFGYTFFSLLYIWNCRNHIKYEFLRKKKQKIWSEQSSAYLSIKIKGCKGSYICWFRFVERLPCDICTKFLQMLLSMTYETEFFVTIHSNLVPNTMFSQWESNGIRWKDNEQSYLLKQTFCWKLDIFLQTWYIYGMVIQDVFYIHDIFSLLYFHACV